jgi:hypothetical protein
MYDAIAMAQFQIDSRGPPPTVSVPHIVAIGFPQLDTVAGGFGITHAE